MKIQQCDFISTTWLYLITECFFSKLENTAIFQCFHNCTLLLFRDCMAGLLQSAHSCNCACPWLVGFKWPRDGLAKCRQTQETDRVERRNHLLTNRNTRATQTNKQRSMRKHSGKIHEGETGGAVKHRWSTGGRAQEDKTQGTSKWNRTWTLLNPWHSLYLSGLSPCNL